MKTGGFFVAVQVTQRCSLVFQKPATKKLQSSAQIQNRFIIGAVKI